MVEGDLRGISGISIVDVDMAKLKAQEQSGDRINSWRSPATAQVGCEWDE
jgi:hypothetical protein